MLPLWRDRLRIVLGPDRVVLARIGKSWRAPVTAEHVEPYAAPVDRPAWCGALDVLAGVLSDKRWQNTEASVILPNNFVRYLLVPWNEGVSNEMEHVPYVRHCFHKIHDQVANSWALRCSQQDYRAPGLASAVDQRLLDELESLIGKHRLRLVSVQPYLMAAFNYWRASFKDPTFWFVLAEKKLLCMALVHRGRWKCIRAVPTDDPQAAMPTLLEREWYLAGLDEARCRVFLYVPQPGNLSFNNNYGWNVCTLKPVPRSRLSPKTDAQHSLAMSM